ncbi:unnamed protein product [Dovyalis caffra]|uniref:Uncharacterized protein n=1 Tax=Dovyalis caffra TaxID=77055 RepID=A0AAV1SRE7_9ROSI|nr:unnamed protein product [Dovyalis caffra]
MLEDSKRYPFVVELKRISSPPGSMQPQTFNKADSIQCTLNEVVLIRWFLELNLHNLTTGVID